ncbi:MAG: hypothetical protein CR954_00085 [Candidatus Moraniibacteriota bacterium]|nr:MAG: hypothetical protein CR954_00085 [Candidatus Moranbacteria bacterium]
MSKTTTIVLVIFLLTLASFVMRYERQYAEKKYIIAIKGAAFTEVITLLEEDAIKDEHQDAVAHIAANLVNMVCYIAHSGDHYSLQKQNFSDMSMEEKKVFYTETHALTDRCITYLDKNRFHIVFAEFKSDVAKMWNNIKNINVRGFFLRIWNHEQIIKVRNLIMKGWNTLKES